MPDKRTKYEEFETIPESKDYRGWLEKNITIAECNNFNGIEAKYIMYDETKLVIGYVDNEDKLHFTKEYLDKLKEKTGEYYDQLGLENREIYLNELPGLEEYITSSDKTLEPEELEKIREQGYNKKEEDQKKDEKEKAQAKEQEQNKYKQVDEENRQIEQDLGLSEGEIIFSAQIKDPEFYDRVPALRKTNKPAKLISTKNDGVLLVSPTNSEKGDYEKIAGISEPKSTNRRALNVGRDGTLFQEEVIMGEFQIKGYEGEYSLGWVMGTGGYPELRELGYERTNDPMANRVLLAAPVETETEKPVTPEVRKLIEENIRQDTTKPMDKIEQIEESGQNVTNIEQIQDESEEPEPEPEREKGKDDDDLEERIRSLFEDPRTRH